MYKRGGHMRGTTSQRTSAPSSSSFSSLSSSLALPSNPQPLHVDGQYGHIDLSSDPQEHIKEQLGHVRTECPSVQHSNVEGNTGEEEDGRFIICPCGDSFTDATYVVRQLNKIVNNSWRGQYICYGRAPKEVKDLWWNEFGRKFRWDETEEDEVRRIFKKKAGDHIRNVMNKAKARQVKPDFITADNWTEIKRIWETERNKQISEQNKKNRASSSSKGSGFATYAGGSINIREHRKRMADELGTKPTCAATFERTFQKKDKSWAGNRAKAIKEKYDELLMSTASSGGGDGGNGGDGDGGNGGVATSEPSVDSMTLWVETSGGIKRGKIFGMGSLSRIYTSKAAATSSFNAAGSRRTQLEEQMTQELSQLKHLLVEKDEEIRVIKQQMQLIIQHLNLDHNEVPPVPPTNPIGDGHNDDEIDDDDDADDGGGGGGDDYVSHC